MLTPSEKRFSTIFAIVLIAELLCGSIQALSTFHYITKPSIVISLILFFYHESKSVSTNIRFLTILALLFSLVGDILLMFVENNALYFIFGLVAFLLAHSMYVLVFLKRRNKSFKPNWIIGVMNIYAIGLFLFLKDNLGEMLIPVLIYMIVILTMATTAFLRTKNVGRFSYNFVFVGAILFMISDSLLAINKFHTAFPLANILIIFTYALAQYFIVFGIKKAQ